MWWKVSVRNGRLNSYPLDKMAAISQTMFSNAFLWMKMFCLIKISLKFVPKGPIHNNPIDNGLAPNRRRTIIWTNADPIHRHIYAALGWDDLTETNHESTSSRNYPLDLVMITVIIKWLVSYLLIRWYLLAVGINVRGKVPHYIDCKMILLMT